MTPVDLNAHAQRCSTLADQHARMATAQRACGQGAYARRLADLADQYRAEATASLARLPR